MIWSKTRCSALRGIALATAFIGLAAFEAVACGAETDCVIGDRSYRIALPESHDAASPIGAIVFVHGYRGTAEGVMRNKAITALASELNVAMIAAQAAGPEWGVPGVPSADAPQGVDELAYFKALIDDAASRFAIDRSRVVVVGFSSGAMMVWHLACYAGDSFAGFVPMSGTFWAPVPESCPTGAVNLIHYHGEQDPIVPLHGRPLKDSRQGDVYEAIDLMARIGGFGPAETDDPPALRCTRRTNPEGKILELCLFDGKHEMKTTHIARAWRAISAAKGG